MKNSKKKTRQKCGTKINIRLTYISQIKREFRYLFVWNKVEPIIKVPELFTSFMTLSDERKRSHCILFISQITILKIIMLPFKY